VVVDTFHHSYSGVRGQENHSLRQTQAKKVCETPSQSGMILCSCGPSYAEGIGRGITVWGWPQAKPWDCT
jgi:hypothetical protein